MEKEIVKEALALAEKESREKKVQEVKKIITETLAKLKEQEKIRDEANKKIKYLKMDVDDFKMGRLDRMVERQEKDEEAKKTSVVVIIKEKETIREVSPWFFPYTVIWQTPIVTYPQPAFYCGGNGTITTTDFVGTCLTTNTCGASLNAVSINCSVAKDATVGAYNVGDEVINLR